MRLAWDLVDENRDKKTYVWTSNLKVSTLKMKMDVYNNG